MAECTISRCSQERRIFRKEFQRWSRNILFVVGFERIAEEFMGRHRWKNFSTPFTELETTDPTDWTPDDICYFCDSKKNPPYDPASGLLHPGDEFLSCRADTDDQSVSSDQGISACVLWRKGGSSSPVSLDQPLDLSVSSCRKEVENGCPCSRGSESESDSTSAGSFLRVPHISIKPGQKRRFDPNGKRSYTEDELQAALRDIQSGKLGTRRAAVIYGIPRSTLRNKVYKMSNDKDRGRRRCVKTQNQSAGTVPTTKEELPVEGESKKIIVSPSKKAKEDDTKTISASCKWTKTPAEGKNGLSSSASESLRQLLKHTIIQKNQASVSAGDEKQGSPASPASLPLKEETQEDGEEEEEEVSDAQDQEEQKMNNNKNKVRKDAEHLAAYHWLNSQDYGQTLAPILSQMLSNIQHLALCKEDSSLGETKQKEELKLPLLPELIRRLAEEKLESACLDRQQAESNTNKQPSSSNPRVKLYESQLLDQGCPPDVSLCPAPNPANSTASEEALSNVILKIPSFKPAKSSQPEPVSDPQPPNQQGNTSSSQNSGNNSRGITVSLKELIARSINQRMGSNNSPQHSNNTKPKGKTTENDLSPNLGKRDQTTVDQSHVENNNHKTTDSETTEHCVLSSMLANSASTGEKRSRPKRGRYRNYDTDNLVQAVRAVQKGEMSVHRAGTHYGVPHSTLEYKVKERHLLRPKKRDSSVSSLLQQHSTSSSSGRSSTLAPISTKNLSREGCKILNGNGSSPVQLPLSLGSESEQHPAVPAVLWQGLPFFPVELRGNAGSGSGEHFFASQMMKRLQENVRLQQHQQEVRGQLLEGLIKATLEKAMAGSPASTALTPPVPRLAAAASLKKNL